MNPSSVFYLVLLSVFSVYPLSVQDNVLGISWKEERELRRAIYVSLRDQHQTSNGQAWTMMSKLRARRSSRAIRSNDNPQPTNSSSVTYLLRGSRQRFSPTTPLRINPSTITRTASNTLRRAKLRATARLNGIASPMGRPSSPQVNGTRKTYPFILTTRPDGVSPAFGSYSILNNRKISRVYI
ncbi:hypothetical protein FGIG_11186 [Fasciola gigantica]|uniref:Uncharacterized protein n=1 Tax=Fasciola gigantica TaxID=46835 RepID=A0A504Z2V1_FASGI|nr:hypothetical protein FGIG_11186 [Fasciola gigantica]